MKFFKVFLLGILLTFSLESLSANGNRAQQLLKGLRSTDSNVRIATIRKAKEAAPSIDVRVHKALLNVALFDPNGHVRKEAQWALVQTDLNQQHVIERLAGALSNEKSSVRLSAVKLSASVHPGNPIVHQKVVRAALFDRDDSVKKAAATALERSKPNHETVINELIEALVKYDSYERVKEILLIILPNNSRAQVAAVLNNENIDIEAVRRTLTEINLNNPGNTESARGQSRETGSGANKTASGGKSPTLSEDKGPDSENRESESRPGNPQEEVSGTKAQKTVTTESGGDSEIYRRMSDLADVALYNDTPTQRRAAYIRLNNLRLRYPQIHQSNPDIYQRFIDLSASNFSTEKNTEAFSVAGKFRTENELHIFLQKNAVRALGSANPMPAEFYWALVRAVLGLDSTVRQLAVKALSESDSSNIEIQVHDTKVVQKLVEAHLVYKAHRKNIVSVLKIIWSNHPDEITDILLGIARETEGFRRRTAEGWWVGKGILSDTAPDIESREKLAAVLESENVDLEDVRRVLREIRPSGSENLKSAEGQEANSAVDTVSRREKNSTLPEGGEPESRPGNPQEEVSGTKAQKTVTTESGAFNALQEAKNIIDGKGPSSPDVYSQLIDSALFSDSVYERNRIILALNNVHLEDKDINRLLEFLNGGNRHINDADRIFDMQRTSIRILGVVHTDSPEIHRRMADVALYEDNSSVRRAAYVVLNDLRLKYPQIHQNNPDIYQQFIDLSAAHKEDITLQRNAVRALGGANPMPAEFYWALVNVVLFSPDIEVRLVAAEGLNKSDLSNIEVQVHDTEVVQKLVEAALAGSRSERKAIVGVLKIIWSDHPDEITDRLLGTTRESEGLIKDNVHLSQKVKGILLGTTPDIESREKLAAVLENENVDLEAVRRVLREIHPNNSESLKSAEVQEANSEVSTVSRREESSTLPEDRESRPLASQEEVSSNGREREEATTEAGVFDALKEANDIILKGNRPTDSTIYVNLAEALLYDSDPNVRRAGFRAFEITKPDIAEVYMKLVNALSSDKPDVQIRALRTLGVLPSTGSNTQNSIVDVALYSTDANVREEANEALRKIEPGSSEIRQKVVDVALYGTNMSVQRNANETLKSMLGISVCGVAF